MEATNNLYAPPPTFITVEKGTLQCIHSALETGREHTQSLLTEHDSSLGRTTRKNRYWAEVLEKDLKQFNSLITILEGLHVNHNPPKGRDIMAVYHMYNGDVIEQKYEGTLSGLYREDNIDRNPSLKQEYFPIDATLPDLESIKFLHLDNGLIRQTKDIEKVVWSYC